MYDRSRDSWVLCYPSAAFGSPDVPEGPIPLRRVGLGAPNPRSRPARGLRRRRRAEPIDVMVAVILMIELVAALYVVLELQVF